MAETRRKSRFKMAVPICDCTLQNNYFMFINKVSIADYLINVNQSSYSLLLIISKS